MSEIKPNLLDSHTLLVGTVHGSTGDRLVAALSAEPETIEELETAFKRFEKEGVIFGIPPCRSERCEIDDRPWDAGILVIDLAARIHRVRINLLIACARWNSRISQWHSMHRLSTPLSFIR